MRRLRTMILAAALGVFGAAGAQRLPTNGMVTPVPAGKLGGIGIVLRFEVARPDRREVDYTFLTAGSPGRLPEEVQVRGADGRQLHLSAQQGADCTLSAVEILTAPRGRGAIVSAVRRFSPILAENDYSAPAAMEVQVYRPAPGGTPGQSSTILQATGAPIVTRKLCDAADVRRSMLAAGAAR